MLTHHHAHATWILHLETLYIWQILLILEGPAQFVLFSEGISSSSGAEAISPFFGRDNTLVYDGSL